MNANEYAERLKKRNSRLFAAGKIQMTPAELENLVRHAFEAGRGSTQDDVRSMFEKVFGK